jgi:hypothetical protein
MSLQAKIERARALFKAFHQREAKASDIAVIAPSKEQVVTLEIGIVHSLIYVPNGTDQPYEHEFEDRLPKLFVTEDGRQAYLIGGAYRFTERGFVK